MSKTPLALLVAWLCLMLCPVQAVSNPLTADSLMALSRACYEDDRLVEALDYATQTLRQAKKEHDEQAYMRALSYIGGIYGVFKDYDKAHYYFKRCLAQAQRLGDADMTARCYSNLTMTSCMLRHEADALGYLRLQEHSQMADTVRYRYFLLSNRGKVAVLQGRWQQALAYSRQARQHAADHQMGLMYEAAETAEMANIYEAMGQDSMTVALFGQMLTMARQAGDQKGVSRALDHLASTYRRMGDSSMAAYYQEQAVLLDDSVFNTQEFNSAKGRLVDFEEEQKAEQISLLNVRINRQLLVILLFATLLAAVVVLAIVLVRRNRSLQEAYQLLVDKHQQAMRQQEQTAKTATDSEHLPAEQHQQLLAAIERILRQDDVICSPDFDLARLSTLVGSNTKYVSWVINDHHHLSFKALLNQYRIQLASKRLADAEHYGHLTIQAIAESVGYKSQTNFIQAFKAIVGMTPSTYQKLAREKQHLQAIYQ